MDMPPDTTISASTNMEQAYWLDELSLMILFTVYVFEFFLYLASVFLKECDCNQEK